MRNVDTYSQVDEHTIAIGILSLADHLQLHLKLVGSAALCSPSPEGLQLHVFLNTKLVPITNITLFNSHKKSMVLIYDYTDVLAVRYISAFNVLRAPCPLSIATWFINKRVTPKLSFHINNKSNVIYVIKLDNIP